MKKYQKYIVIIFIAILSLFIGVFSYQKPLNNLNINTEAKTGVGDFITLNVLGKTYKQGFIEGDTVYVFMDKLNKDKSTGFSFNYKEYPGLGVFIEEINGVKNSQGKYWIYYVNDKEASVGASNYVLKAGDIISWKQE